MSTRKLRSKLEQVRHFLPLKRTRSPPTGAGLSEKMLQPIDHNVALAHDSPPPPPPPPKDRTDWDDIRHAVDLAGTLAERDRSALARADSPASQHVIFLARQMKRPPSYSKLPPLPTELGEMHPPASPTVPPKPHARARTASSRIPVAAGRLSAEQRRAATISTPEEAELRRREAQRRKEQEEQEALREEAQRQARLKREKEQLLKQFAEEEAARKAALEAELRHAKEERRRREAIEREAEALESMLAAERKRQERERRRQETEKLQRLRKELEQRNRAPEKEREAWREKTMRARRERLGQLAEKKFKTDRGLTVLLTGWVTVQSEDCLSWKRRYFQLRESELVLFKDAEDNSQPLETVPLERVQRIREWQEGFEELEPIPNSFALEVKGEREPRSMFTDNADDKENLLALLGSKLSTR
ncbi:hypothetical protein C8Q77DRAFT_1142573 [Trametes polyzona]|nr:hypothetical protein C8Q77DRAFT_1142573 [Trametes polyzona]